MSTNYKFSWRGDDFARVVPEAANVALDHGAITLQKEMKQTLTNKSPSAPNTPPGVRTGLLRKSISYMQGSTRFSRKVGTALTYGRFLEFGTSKMAPRPWVWVSFYKAKPKIQSMMMAAFRSSLAQKLGATVRRSA